jgi:hypothetical protein
MNRPELEKAIYELGAGDVLVVPEWDRATRSMFDGIDIIKRRCWTNPTSTSPRLWAAVA